MGGVTYWSFILITFPKILNNIFTDSFCPKKLLKIHRLHIHNVFKADRNTFAFLFIVSLDA